ncbi:MAG: ferredoxin [Myxococcota bacterium]
MSRIEIHVDRDACTGARACVLRAPASFTLDADRKAVAAAVPGDADEALLAAARSCPNFAIELRRDGEPVA